MKTNILIGSHGVGKTTLIQEVKETLPHLYVSDGFSRPINKTNTNISKEDKQILINELTCWRWIEDRGKNCLFTRSIIDIIVYTNTLYPHLNIDKYIDLFNQYRDNYRFFYIPIEFDLIGDDMRSDDLRFQTSIDISIREFLNKYNVHYTTLSGSVTERLSVLIKNIQ